MDPRAFHQLAQELAKGSRPADFRTAIGRAYYAAFHVGVEVLQVMHFPVPRNQEGHAYVRDALQNAGDAEVAQAGEVLKDLARSRVCADYFLNQRNIETQGIAEFWVQAADRVIHKLGAAVSDPQRSKVVRAAIQQWNSTRHSTVV